MGRNWQWWTAGIFLLATILISVRALSRPVNTRWHLFLTATVCFVAMIDYLFMATGHGMWYSAGNRESYWVLYLDWMITCPILLYILGRFSNFSAANQYLMFFFMEMSLAFGFFAAYTTTPARFAYFVFGFLCFLPVWRLVFEAHSADPTVGFPKILGIHFNIVIVNIFWLIYPIIWLLGTGLNKMCVDSTIMAFAALDVLSKVLFALYIVLYADSLPPPVVAGALPLGALAPQPTGQPPGKLQANSWT